MSIEILTSYGQELATHGYQVWLTRTGQHGGYLQYKDLTTGDWGSLQYGHEGWQHLMPLVPSREFGSSMHLDTTTNPFTLKAARECARPFNTNKVVGRQANAKGKTWRSTSAIQL